MMEWYARLRHLLLAINFNDACRDAGAFGFQSPQNSRAVPRSLRGNGRYPPSPKLTSLRDRAYFRFPVILYLYRDRLPF